MIPDYQIHLYMIRIYNESQSLTHPYQNLYQHFHSHIHDSLFGISKETILGNQTKMIRQFDGNTRFNTNIPRIQSVISLRFEVEKPNPPSANNRTTLLLKKK